MQISMRSVSDIGTIDRVFSPHEDTGFREYLRERWDQSMDYLEKYGSRVSSKFVERAKRIFDNANSSEALRRTRQAIRAANGVKRASSIYRTTDLEEMRSAGYAMQRFMMAEVTTRQKFLRQQVDGFSETYQDMHKGHIGEAHYDYRRVMDGVWRQEQIDGEDVMVREVYFENLVDGDRDLDPEEQHAILDTWDIQKMFLLAGTDPTNRLGGDAG